MSVTPPIPAATVVILRPARLGPGLEVLLTERPSTMAFGPGIWVFPGGRVDEADGSAVAAAVREAREEVGLDLEPTDLVPMTRWVTPPSLPRRFDVRFFAAPLPAGARIRRHRGEVASARWLTPASGLRAMATGRLGIWQPTAVTLQQLEGLRTVADVQAAFAPSSGGAPARTRVGPRVADSPVARVDGGWAGGIEGRRWTGWLVGTRELVVVDPGDPTDETLGMVSAMAAARGGRLVGCVLTSLHPVRHAGVEMFHSGLDLPIVAGRGARRLASYEVAEVGPGDRLPFGDAAVSVEPGSGPDQARPESIDLVVEGRRRLVGGSGRSR